MGTQPTANLPMPSEVPFTFAGRTQPITVGGRVFIMDPASYDEPHMSWLAQQTTFSRADFDRFRGKPAFVCEDARFREVLTLVNGTE